MPSRIDDYLRHIQLAADAGAWYAALALALAMPDICATIEYPSESKIGKRYRDWCDSFVRPNDQNLAGADVYVLRCSFLHTGTGEIQDQRAAYKDARLGRIYLTQSAGVSPDGVRKMAITPTPAGTATKAPPQETRSRYALPVGDFCDLIIRGVTTWMTSIAGDSAKLTELDLLLEIHAKSFSPA